MSETTSNRVVYRVRDDRGDWKVEEGFLLTLPDGVPAVIMQSNRRVIGVPWEIMEYPGYAVSDSVWHPTLFEAVAEVLRGLESRHKRQLDAVEKLLESQTSGGVA